MTSCDDSPKGRGKEGVSELEDLKEEEESLQDEIADLKKRLRDTADEDEIADLEDEIDDLEKKLDKVQTQEAVVTKEVADSVFCNRSAPVRYALKDLILGHSPKILLGTNSEGNTKETIKDCRDVTEYMLAQITSGLRLQVSSLKEGDLDHLRKIVSLDLSNNKMTSLPEGIFDDLVALTELKLDGNNFSDFPDGTFDTLKKYSDAPHGIDILVTQRNDFFNMDEFDSTSDDSILPDGTIKVREDCNSGLSTQDRNALATANKCPTPTPSDCWNGVKYAHNEYRDFLSAFNRLKKPSLYTHFEDHFKAHSVYSNIETEYETWKDNVKTSTVDTNSRNNLRGKCVIPNSGNLKF